VSLQRGIDGAEPVRPSGDAAGPVEERRALAAGHLGTGSLACPRCDAPVALGAPVSAPADPLACPFCAHAGAVRDFLSLAAPARPARVRLRVVSAPPR
jgi:hypothetical protein